MKEIEKRMKRRERVQLSNRNELKNHCAGKLTIAQTDKLAATCLAARLLNCLPPATNSMYT